MYTYETQVGGTIVKLALEPGKVVGTALSPGGEPIAVELPCPYTPDTIGPHWIDFANFAAEQSRLATNFPGGSPAVSSAPQTEASDQRQTPPAPEDDGKGKKKVEA